MNSKWNFLSTQGQQTRALLLIAVVATLVHLFIAMNTPVVIMTWQIYDDGLYVRLGQYLAMDHWLGPFDQFTLMKGPGYPLFLAFNYWIGLPITLTQALLYCTALAGMSVIVLKSSGSRVLALLIYLIPVLDPRVFAINRILRDDIYLSQATLVLATFSYSLFIAKNYRARLWSAVVSGILFGWFWLTREEGIWLLPGLATLVLCAVFRKKLLATAASWLSPTLAMIGLFVLVQLLFATANFIHYRSFSGVDFKERNFQEAIAMLESVQSTKTISFVSVPREVREKVYAISPSFASLRPYIDPESGPSRWEAGECGMHVSACGDIGTGFFVWAVRDAVAAVGKYDSPKSASRFYAQMVAEIQSACDDGRLHCVKKLIPYMPRMTSEQLWDIPKSAAALLRQVVRLGADPAPKTANIFGPEGDFQSTIDFLNNPTHFPLANTISTSIDISGWYYHANLEAGWFTVQVLNDQGVDVPYSLVRADSPDLVQGFHDTQASRQRFSFHVICVAKCTIKVTGADGAILDVPLSGSLLAKDRILKIGAGLLALDSQSVRVANGAYDDHRTKRSGHLRRALYELYGWVLQPLLILGFVSFVVSCFLVFLRRQCPVVIGIAAACWVSSLARSVILILVDASSFSVMSASYAAPIFTLTVIASMLSIYAFFAIMFVRQSERRAIG